MNVLMVSRGVFSLPPSSSGGGAEKHAYELSLALARRGHSVHLVTSTSSVISPLPGFKLCRASLDGGFIHPNVPFYGWLIKHGLAGAATFRTTMRELRDRSAHYDVLHVHGNFNAFLLSRLVKRVPIVYSVHDPPPSIVDYERMDERLVRKTVFRTMDLPALTRMDHVISVNPAIKQSLIASGINSERISVVPSGMHPTPLTPRNRDESLGIFVGQLVHRKGVHYLLEAVSSVSSLRLLVVGEGPEKARLLELANRLGCSDRVTFCGYVPESKLQEYYTRVSFGVFPTLVDAMPTLALLECMAHGILPIVSKVPGADWVIRSGENGLLFTPRSVPELREILSRLAADEYLRIRLGENARRHVEQNFDWDMVANRVESVYAKVNRESS